MTLAEPLSRLVASVRHRVSQRATSIGGTTSARHDCRNAVGERHSTLNPSADGQRGSLALAHGDHGHGCPDRNSAAVLGYGLSPTARQQREGSLQEAMLRGVVAVPPTPRLRCHSVPTVSPAHARGARRSAAGEEIRPRLAVPQAAARGAPVGLARTPQETLAADVDRVERSMRVSTAARP